MPIKSIIHCVIFILLAILSPVIYASLPVYDHYSSKDGLTDEFVKSLAEDKNGYIWIGTIDGLFKFDGVRFSHIEINSNASNLIIKKIHIDYSNNIWVASFNQGLYKFNQKTWIKIPSSENNKPLTVKSFYSPNKNTLWLGTTEGLKIINSNDEISDFSSQYQFYDVHETISRIVKISSNQYMFTFKGGLILCDFKEGRYHKFQNKMLSDNYIYDAFLDSENILWLATSKALIQFDVINKTFHKVNAPFKNMESYALAHYKDKLFVATFENGLLTVNLNDHSIKQYKKDQNNPQSLKDNSIAAMLISDKNILWLGNYYKGLSRLDLPSLNFNYETNAPNSINCAQSNVFFSAFLDKENNLYLGSGDGLIRYNTLTKECLLIQVDNKYHSLFSNITNMIEYNNHFYISTWKGLIDFDKHLLKVNRVIEQGKDFKKLFIHKNNLYFYDAFSGIFKLIKEKKVPVNTIDINTKGLVFNDLAYDKDGTVFIATNKGLTFLNQTDSLMLYKSKYNNIFEKGITAILIKDNEFYLTTNEDGLYHLNANGELMNHYEYGSNLARGTVINKIVANNKNKNLWMGSDKGLVRLKDGHFHLFMSSDGINNTLFYPDFAFYGHDEQLYFGGQNGFVHFDPEAIELNSTPPRVVLNHLLLMNQVVEIDHTYDSGFKIEKPINELNQIELGYKDYIIGFEFAALDYADPMRNQYAYRLQGLNDKWVTTDANDRKVTFTNLAAGEYLFQVKAANKDGIWSVTPKQLKIIVYPAPWLSPWAFFLYFMLIIAAVWIFIRYKTYASRKRAEQLELTVEQRTHEVKQQKKIVESLLNHKNEVFANVTHEFKTPLALILGPTDQLVNEPELNKYSDKLNMIHRNAKRLILMVGQILKLSQAEFDKEIIRESQAVNPILTMLFESFYPLAQDKGVHLKLKNQYKANVYATPDCLEMVIGNLISNALKYTNPGGTVLIRSERNEDYISVYVSDSGSGIDSHDLEKIFTRFTRLDSHKSIQGTGIGLSVVKEITEANNGQVTVNSELGKGSEFMVTFPVTKFESDAELSQETVDQLVGNTETDIALEKSVSDNNVKLDKKKTTVLIIEDNHDMQEHIGNVLKTRFNCLFANRGKYGIALALKEVPDIVICDVMMPEMDGYQVTRILRHDARLSHIPIILLTALNTKESRIKGWRENIDVYVSKPFDATELNIQIDNILSIRKLLQKKTNKAIKTNDSLESLDLPEQDLIFIKKLKDVIGKYYVNEYFQKADIASKMALSERQLLRKVKALIDENPMDMLRDYRLEQATHKLRTGKQISIISDACGFSSVSYFGTCFKKKYGVTPKQYQSLNKQKI